MSVTETGATIWLTGLPSAGKTTIAYELAGRLRGEGHRVEVLDGDEIREFLSAGLGFSREDRHTNVQRIGFVAELLAANGVKVLVPVIAPYADSRDAVRKRHQSEGTAYLEVHVATPVEVCSERDVEGALRQAGGGRDQRADRGRRPVRGSRVARPADRVAPADRAGVRGGAVRAAEREGCGMTTVATVPEGTDNPYALSHLDSLESEAVHIFREVAA